MKKSIVWLAVCVVGLTGCVSKGRYDLKVLENIELKEEIQKLQDTKEDLELDVYSLEHEKKSIKGKLDETKQEKEKLDTTYKNLVGDMKKEIEKGQIKITQLKNKLTINMVDKILFPTGEAQVKKQGKKVLDQIGAILKDVTDKQIRIEGHTDNVPVGKRLQKKFPTNWELSVARATNVARYLIDKTGVRKEVVSVAGYADNKPIDTNETSKSRARNRRIEIILVPLDAGRIETQLPE